MLSRWMSISWTVHITTLCTPYEQLSLFSLYEQGALDLRVFLFPSLCFLVTARLATSSRGFSSYYSCALYLHVDYPSIITSWRAGVVDRRGPLHLPHASGAVALRIESTSPMHQNLRGYLVLIIITALNDGLQRPSDTLVDIRNALCGLCPHLV